MPQSSSGAHHGVAAAQAPGSGGWASVVSIAVTGSPSPLDTPDEVWPEPLRHSLGQRRDEDLVEVAIADGSLDGVERVLLARQAVNGTSSRTLEQWNGMLHRPVRGADCGASGISSVNVFGRSPGELLDALQQSGRRGREIATIRIRRISEDSTCPSFIDGVLSSLPRGVRPSQVATNTQLLSPERGEQPARIAQLALWATAAPASKR